MLFVVKQHFVHRKYSLITPNAKDNGPMATTGKNVHIGIYIV